VTFSESVTGADVADFSLAATGTAAGTIASVSGAGSTYTVTVNNITGDGTLRLDFNDSETGIGDTAGNVIDSGFADGEVYTFDHTVPSVSIVQVDQGWYGIGQHVDFTVTFDEAIIVDVTTGTPRVAITLDNGNTVYASYLEGSGGNVLTFRYTVMSGDVGESGISLSATIDANGGTLRDAAGNDAALALSNVNIPDDVRIDAVTPSVLSVERVEVSPTNATTVEYTVSFSELVNSVTVDDFALFATGTVTGTLAAVRGEGSTYIVTVTDITGDGTLRLDVNGTGIADSAANLISGSFTSGAAYAFDQTAPSIASVSVPADGIYVAGQSLDFIVNFDEVVTVDITGGSPRLALALDTGGTVYASYVSGGDTTALTFRYLVSSGELDSDGISVAALDANGATLRDAAGNDANPTLNGVGNMAGVLVDAVAPSVASITRVGAATTSASSVSYTVTFSESVSGVDIADFLLTTTGETTGTITSVSGSGMTYTVTVSSITGDGTLRLDLNDNGTGIADAATNAIITGFTSGEIYVFDHSIVDVTGPAVASVGLPSNATYAAGDTLDFIVNFDEVVTVDTGSGTPRIAITLDTGGTVYASYVSGSDTSALTFSYTVTSGQLDTDGISLAGSIDINGGTLRDGVGNDATLMLNGAGSTMGVLIDAVAPNVVSITTASAATSNASSVQYTVTFSENVTGVDVADFVLSASGTAAGTIASIGGSGTTYTVTVNNITGNGTLRLDLNGSGTSISDTAGNVIDSGFADGEAYTFDHTGPTVSVVQLDQGLYGIGRHLDFTVTFDEAVSVDVTDGTPRFAIALDSGNTVYANYLEGSGGNVLTFRYTVMSGDAGESGIGVGAAIETNGGTLRDAAGNDAALMLNNVNVPTDARIDAVAPSVLIVERVEVSPTNATTVEYAVSFSEFVNSVTVDDFALFATGTVTGTIAAVRGDGANYIVTVTDITGDGTLRLDVSGAGIADSAANLLSGGFNTGDVYTVDQSAPSVSSVGVPENGTYVAGQSLDFTVNFDESIGVLTDGGTPRLALTLATGGTVYASYVSGSDTNALTFRYTVVSGELDSDGISVADSIDVNGGALRDFAGNDVDPALNGVGSPTGVLVDAVAPSVVSITRVDAATSNASSVQYTVTFSENVTGVDVADFALSASGTAAGTIASISGDGATYTVTVNGISGDGTLRLDLNGRGTGIVDLPGTALESGFSTGELYTFDHTAPSVSSVGVPASGTYAAGETLDFVVNFDESVVIDTTGGTPRLALTLDSGGTVYASYVSGSGTGALTFSYTVMRGQLDTDGILLGGSIDANGGSLRDSVGNDAALALSGAESTAAVLVDAVAPSVATVDVPASGAYGVGDSLDFAVNFDESITVDTTGGTPRIALQLDNGATVYASYVSGSSTSVLTFRYTMDVAFDTGIAIGSSIEPNGAILRDGALNDATLALKGLGDISAVRLDGVPPAVATIIANGSSFSNAQSMAYTVTFSEDVSGVDIADFSLSTTGTVAGTIESIARVNGSTYIVNVTGIIGDGTLRLDLNDGGTGIVDAAGNSLAGGLTGDTVGFDHSPPVILAVEVPAGGAYGVGEALEFRIRFDDRVDVDTTSGSPRLALLLSSGAIVYADYTPDKASAGSALTFRYVVADDFAGKGIRVAGIDLNGGRLVSPLGVDVDLTLNGVGDVSDVTVDAVAPSIASITRLAAPSSNADSVTYLVTFSEDVSGIRAGSFSLTTTGTLSISTGAMRRTGGNTFLVTVTGIRGDGTLQLHVNGSGVTDLAGTALGNESIAGEIYTFDHTPPGIVTVDLPSSANYVAGQSLELTVHFNESVSVDTVGGKPRIAITLGSGTVYADYVSGSGTSALTFRYVVGGFDVGPNGVTIASRVELNGAILTDAVGNRAELAMTNVGTLPGVTVGTRASIVVTPPPSPMPASNPIIITQLPASSALPPILNAFNTSGGGITMPTSLSEAAGTPSSMGALPGALPNRETGRETGTQSNGDHSGDHAAASTATSGFVTLRDNRVGETSALRAGAALQPLTLPANRPFELSLPSNTFIGGAGSRIAVEARLADGKPLPAWLKFDPRTGKFVGTPPPGQGGAISIQVIASDGNGEAAVVVLDLQFGADAAEVTDSGAADGEPVSSTSNALALEQLAVAPGKASLNSQFRAHGFNAWQQQVDTLVQHAREAVSTSDPSLSIAKVKQS
jgi:hypothetical protein